MDLTHYVNHLINHLLKGACELKKTCFSRYFSQANIMLILSKLPFSAEYAAYIYKILISTEYSVNAFQDTCVG